MNKRRLILGGGGDEVLAKELDDFYGKIIGSNAKVLYTPIAMETNDFDSCLNWFSNAYSRFGFDIQMLVDLNDCDDKYLDDFDSIYIGGGNTFSLLHKFRKNNFLKNLTNFIDSGKVVYGGSAGAIIFGKNIGTAGIGTDSDSNDVCMTNLSGLDMVSGYMVQCHYEDDQYIELKRFAEKIEINTYALREESGLYIEGDKIRFVGDVIDIKVK